jgi:FKBP-type peptidyl-prolyl cis-trans isomerase SlyD
MTDTLTVQDQMVVGIHYTLKNNDGDELDTSIGFDPLFYLHGAQNIVPGLEAGLLGLTVGDKKTVVVAPADGYGERSGKPPVEIPRSNFPPNIDVQAGMMFHTEGPDGNPLPLWVKAVTEANVIVDTDHPLAGVTLNFDVEITEVRAASEEERSHGHVHGPGGHHH